MLRKLEYKLMCYFVYCEELYDNRNFQSREIRIICNIMNIVHKNCNELFSLDNIFLAWKVFRRGKTSKRDVMDFEMHLEDNIFCLYEQLHNGVYKHSPYKHFVIFDNKKRDIYKAEVGDRIAHQIVHDYLLSIFNPKFIQDSYASRINKGQHKAVEAFRYFVKLALGHREQCFVLKCDVKKYFDNIDQCVLFSFIKDEVYFHEELLKVTKEIISSYGSINFGKGLASSENTSYSKGIPLGNVTSQIFANIYLNALDQYVKKELRCRFYVRYNDDLIIVMNDKDGLEKIRSKIIDFAKDKLLLEIPMEKTSIRKIGWGVDFLGYNILPKVVLLRDKTKHKIYSNISEKNIHSYMSILKHCSSYNLRNNILVVKWPKKSNISTWKS
jgi:RNA-directed DNA polymerase